MTRSTRFVGLIQKVHLLFQAWIIEEFSNPGSNLFVDTAHMYLENAVFLNTAYIAKGTESVDTYT